ncbi:MAG: type 4a pilus biogenesis protein PilO [Gallionellaceae bacterium]|nr:type 4a pilus biogenesis protein PilO [Gallionellaceae bacterium]
MMGQLQQLRQDLGWQGISGAALLLLGLIFSTVVLQPHEERVVQIREQSQNQRSSMSEQMHSAALKSPGIMLAKFYDFFISRQEITDHLAKIYSLAQANGLELREGDYKVVRNKDEQVTQYQISLPVAGGYNQIRSFTAQVLDGIAVISLDQIKFDHKHANDPRIEAQIMFTLYWVQS